MARLIDKVKRPVFTGRDKRLISGFQVSGIFERLQAKARHLLTEHQDQMVIQVARRVDAAASCLDLRFPDHLRFLATVPADLTR